ncbi:MAG: leucyl/phenylalanyl-tRNA--protein transferase [Actinomycetales bacterium]|nr:leucyl/phenylalanyl-tRNA--protein transferase [Actinomycetales bacterium]
MPESPDSPWPGPRDPGPAGWVFPDPRDAPAGEAVIAVGADLEPGTLVLAYSSGLFPMHLSDGPLAWWSPDPRGVLPLDGMRITRSLRASARQFTITFNRAFDAVVQACAQEGRPDRWITEEFMTAYGRLHELGWAHSVEAWRDGELAGGLYGVEVGGLFAGESMFHRRRDASKVALLALVQRLRLRQPRGLLDVQWRTDHLATLGVVEVPRPAYLDLLAEAIRLAPCLGRPDEQGRPNEQGRPDEHDLGG